MPWFRTGSFILIATCFIHLFGHFQTSSPANEPERRLMDLMTGYIFPSTHGSMMDLLNGFSLFFALFFIMTGELNLWLSKVLKTDLPELKKIAVVNMIGLGIGTGLSLKYFFWAPTLCIAAAFVSFAVAWFTLPSSSPAE